MDQPAAIAATGRWIETMVIGLNLCPFARRVFQADLIRYRVSEAADEEGLLEELGDELRLLAATPIEEVETTLLIHPRALTDFNAFNSFLGVADRLVDALGLRGEIQLASFHPHYRFEGTSHMSVENYTNRSPYPMVHLLREESISRIARDEEEMLEIPRRNIAMLKSLGRKKITEMLDQCQAPRGD
jgi:hypothetical protein